MKQVQLLDENICLYKHTHLHETISYVFALIFLTNLVP